MRCRLTHAALMLALAVILGVAVAPLSSAAGGVDCRWQSRLHTTCTVGVTTNPDPSTAPVSADEPRDTGAGSSCIYTPGVGGQSGPQPVPCTSSHGSWVNSLGCYVSTLDTQPNPNDPAWNIEKPDEGAVYGCYYPPPRDLYTQVWLLNPPEPSAAGPSPRAVAEMAIEQMDLQAIQVGIVPEPRPGYIGIIGQPVWMWAANPSASTVGPITRSASAGGITVTATARIRRITWSMGDGSTVTCAGGGTPFTDDRAGTASPDCGYVYSTSSAGQPGDKFTVTASSDWVIEWAGAGQTGTIRVDDLERSTQIAVGEAQVLVTS